MKILMLANCDLLDVHVSILCYWYTAQVRPWADSQAKS